MAGSGGKAVVYLIIGFFLGLGAIISGAKRYLLYQKIRNTPTSKVEAAAVGLAELSGTTRCDGDMRSPISGVRCGYWRIIAEYYRSGKHGGWRQFFKSDSGRVFFLEDETGRMRIDPEGADVDIPIDRRFEGYLSGKGMFGMPHQQIDPDVMKFVGSLDQAGQARFNSYSKSNVRVSEYYIADGDPLYVLGTVKPIEGGTSSIGYENVSVSKGSDVMYIRDTQENKFIGDLRNSVLWQVLGGAAVSGACLFLLLFIFNV
ncbi:MAG: hypothetical protein U0R44_01585 [Candidatus Micrarchaeia archaeon]